MSAPSGCAEAVESRVEMCAHDTEVEGGLNELIYFILLFYFGGGTSSAREDRSCEILSRLTGWHVRVLTNDAREREEVKRTVPV